jgi:hypothetical protein
MKSTSTSETLRHCNVMKSCLDWIVAASKRIANVTVTDLEVRVCLGS